jgi:hypothetical protein
MKNNNRRPNKKNSLKNKKRFPYRRKGKKGGKDRLSPDENNPEL